MKIKITGGCNMPCPYSNDVVRGMSCDDCPGRDGENVPCHEVTTWTARTMIGYHIKLFLMKILYDYIEVEVED